MDASRSEFYVNEGDEVFGSDGDKVGKVIAVQNDYVVVEKGWFFPTDYYIPSTAIASYDDGKMYLNVTKDIALDQGWDTAPVVATDYETTTVSDTGTVRETDYAEVDTATATAFETDRDTRTTMGAGDTLNVPVYEEELTATKTMREVGGARIEKDVVSEEQVLDVPVSEERLKVVRRTVDRQVDASDAGTAFEEVIVDVPVRVEDVEVAKRVRVGEEIEIQKEEVESTERVSGTVRHEEVRITEAADGTVVDDREATR
ncbi:MAG: DUF2382 domain-containing protein [Chloroflexota bacterium]|nr:DUF2382 domain-containing protein [Chloroflexota bacterium]